jgi:hypothetical protein
MIKTVSFSVAVLLGLQLLAGAGAFSPKSHHFGSKPTLSSDNALMKGSAASPLSVVTCFAFQPLPASEDSSANSYRFGHNGMPSNDDVLRNSRQEDTEWRRAEADQYEGTPSFDDVIYRSKDSNPYEGNNEAPKRKQTFDDVMHHKKDASMYAPKNPYGARPKGKQTFDDVIYRKKEAEMSAEANPPNEWYDNKPEQSSSSVGSALPRFDRQNPYSANGARPTNGKQTFDDVIHRKREVEMNAEANPPNEWYDERNEQRSSSVGSALPRFDRQNPYSVNGARPTNGKQTFDDVIYRKKEVEMNAAANPPNEWYDEKNEQSSSSVGSALPRFGRQNPYSANGARPTNGKQTFDDVIYRKKEAEMNAAANPPNEWYDEKTEESSSSVGSALPRVDRQNPYSANGARPTNGKSIFDDVFSPRRDAAMNFAEDQYKWNVEPPPEQGNPSVGSSLPRPPNSAMNNAYGPGGSNGETSKRSSPSFNDVLYPRKDTTASPSTYSNGSTGSGLPRQDTVMSATNGPDGINYDTPNRNSAPSFNDLFYGRKDTAMSAARVPDGWNSETPNVGFVPRKDTAVSTTTFPNGWNSETPNVLPRQDSAMSAYPNGSSAEPPKRRFPDKDMSNIYRQNQIWKQQKLDEDRDFFNKLGSAHKPDYMWIGKCNFD